MGTSLLDVAVHAAGEAAAGFVFPVQHYTLTQKFGNQNGYDAGGHGGIDMAAPLGTPVLAAADGVISFSGPASGFGANYVTEAVAGGLTAGYGHMKASYVHQGQQVRAGQIIGIVGSEGQSTGPHLHFQLRTANGGRVDPLAWLTGHGAVATEGTGGAQTVSSESDGGVAGAITGAIGNLLDGALVAAVKGLLVLGGGAMVVLGVAATARRTDTGQRVEAKAKETAKTAATTAATAAAFA